MEINIEQIVKRYDDPRYTIHGYNTVDDCFDEAHSAASGDFVEDPVECKYYLDTDIEVEQLFDSICTIITSGRMMEKCLKENKFTDDPRINQLVIMKIKELLNNRGE